MTCTNLGKKNLADSVVIYGRGRELFKPPTYAFFQSHDRRKLHTHINFRYHYI